MKRPVVLVVRDGWGINPEGNVKAVENGDATLLAATPYHNYLYGAFPHSTLRASGEDVGLPSGQMGNSEVGHLNLGAGRIVYQDLTRINKAIQAGVLSTNPVLQQAFSKARSNRLHLLGLVSDGGVHSQQMHLVALANAARTAGVAEILVHVITDGRDSPPTSGAQYLTQLSQELSASQARIATVVGRYFAMDRDKRWTRSKVAWDAIVLGRGEKTKDSPSIALAGHYASGETDEFIRPLIFLYADQPRIHDGDVVLFFNFRSDRARQLSMAFLQNDFSEFSREVTPAVHYITLTEYSSDYKCPVIFPHQTLENVLGEAASKAGLHQLRIAETEKYPHVTHFFNGGIEQPFLGEDRITIPSPREVPTYDLKPEMSATELAHTAVEALAHYDLVIMNFANPDMVGHTGVLEAAIQAVEVVDKGVEKVVEATLALGGCLLITADHGNCEKMRNADGSAHTAHTTNPVHLVFVSRDACRFTVDNGILADIAPTLLSLLNLKRPSQMTGKNLLRRKLP
ncbi:2,3-bisphosphoglycerate-independent phosphoglycerate mutase [Candidatus Xiphinematobacter sp. Idaho Grape]|uniref:2,3-bisphosphoglycerate-independent phosphoglycerate mutase n=1 Tax=Candidatus Xiphinematobacter sp. Idaho Grape TaxID=1704307 RepID=UPI000706D060|nr:2,3-bisphosphoglycerate-independent phosphoglycerate mutase [Candidatus Xiphinematobacter sp. Idaho Grape]ALJ56317.1 2,3-bisphosphoglycerate-independent phosphoglycerate mutase [Candidatus Xiphinematobacter sp. Idaho Grape]